MMSDFYEEDFNKFLREILGEKNYDRFRNPIISDYQRDLEKAGWIYWDNFEASNPFENIEFIRGWARENEDEKETKRLEKSFEDSSGRSFRKILEFKRKDLKKRLGVESVRFARAYNMYGERVPSNKRIVAVYVKYPKH